MTAVKTRRRRGRACDASARYCGGWRRWWRRAQRSRGPVGVSTALLMSWRCWWRREKARGDAGEWGDVVAERALARVCARPGVRVRVWARSCRRVWCTTLSSSVSGTSRRVRGGYVTRLCMLEWTRGRDGMVVSMRAGMVCSWILCASHLVSEGRAWVCEVRPVCWTR